MIILLIVLALLCLYKIKPSKYHEDYMSRSQTGSIKGIFAVIIFLSHIRSYITLTSSVLDTTYSLFFSLINQLMVALFFFYSGYGIMEAYKNKENYTKGFLKNRVLKTWLHFVVAVACYAIVSLFIGDYSWQEYAFCWIGWTSIGNSNWFIFVILLLYILTFFAFFVAERIFKKRKAIWATIFVTGLSVVAGVGLRLSGKESWWYDTILCYPCGMLFSLCKARLDGYIQKSGKRHYAVLFGIFILFVAVYIVFYKWAWGGIATYNICACLFCLSVVLITTVLKIDNPILRWLGKYSFLIYIFQRLPMIVFAEIGLSAYRWIFIVISLIVTLLLSVCFEKLYAYIDGALSKPSKKKREENTEALSSEKQR